MEEPRKQFFKMDIVKALRELYDEKKRLDAAIAALEARVKAAQQGLRRESLQRTPRQKKHERSGTPGSVEENDIVLGSPPGPARYTQRRRLQPVGTNRTSPAPVPLPKA